MTEAGGRGNETLRPFHLGRWIEENRERLRPPVNNAVLWTDTEFLVVVAGGPNARSDYHDGAAEEYFHQIEGDMVLRVMESGGPREVTIREGEVLLLPPRVRHSPQRPAGSVGIVVERVRRPGEIDAFEWYCDRCHARVHRHELELRDLVADIPPVFEEYYRTVAAKSCPACGAPNPGRPGPS